MYKCTTYISQDRIRVIQNEKKKQRTVAHSEEKLKVTNANLSGTHMFGIIRQRL
jgi:hypothetical protein